MGIRSRVIVAVGFGVLVAVAAMGGRAYLGADTYPTGWDEHAIHSMSLSHDRQTVYVQADPEISMSCYDARAEVEAGAGRWTVTLEARRTKDFCQLGACIDPNRQRRSGPARTLPPGEEPSCTTATVELDEPVPDDVDVVPA